MPELNGLDATRQIVKAAPDTKVLVLTMHYSEVLARDVLQAGARGYLLKSDADENLIAAVDSLQRHERREQREAPVHGLKQVIEESRHSDIARGRDEAGC